MKSKGGKIFYRCESCFSSDIFKTHTVGFINIYICNSCNKWGYWKDRLKQSVLEYFNSVRPIAYKRKGNNVVIESHGVIFKINRVRVHPGMLYEENYPTRKGEKYYYDKAWLTVDGKQYEIHGFLK